MKVFKKKSLGRNDQFGLLKPILMKLFGGKCREQKLTESMPWQNSAVKSVIESSERPAFFMELRGTAEWTQGL